jgi:thioredoxin-related protein
LGGDKVAKKYHVSAYPTIYLIDKEGKIIFYEVGYGEGLEKTLEKIIKAHLK